jgi:diguanylate cyclase (GGDEF)-like protein
MPPPAGSTLHRWQAMSDDASGRETRACDQTASDRDQTSSDHDQTTSDRDQTTSDRDQQSSDRDQRSSNEDQEAANADVAAGSDRQTHARTTEARERTTDDREATSEQRDELGRERSGTATERDHAATLRDVGAVVRDTEALLRDQETDAGSTWQDILLRAAYDRERASVDRERAADDRVQAAADRAAAARERVEALRVRTESAALLEQAATDQLTGTRTRFLGLDEASRELARTHRRPGGVLMVAFVDVDGLKRINDSRGHLAGDALLRLVGKTLAANLRPYDVIVRYGGDEFVCAMPDMSAPEARARFLKICHALAAVDAAYSLGFGLAQSTETDTLDEVIARADSDLFSGRSAE